MTKISTEPGKPCPICSRPGRVAHVPTRGAIVDCDNLRCQMLPQPLAVWNQLSDQRAERDALREGLGELDPRTPEELYDIAMGKRMHIDNLERQLKDTRQALATLADANEAEQLAWVSGIDVHDRIVDLNTAIGAARAVLGNGEAAHE